MPAAVTFPNAVNELNSWSFTADLTKDDGTALGPAALDTLTLTLYNVSTMDPAVPASGIINAVDHVNIKNTGRATLDAAGHLVVSLTSADNPIVGSDVEERHAALIIGTWNAGAGYTSQVVFFSVTNVIKVPA